MRERGPGHEGGGNPVEGQDLTHPTAVDRRARHPEDDAGRLVLGDGQGARLVHLEHSPGAVVLHAGEHDARGVGHGGLRGRAEQDIDAGPVAADRRVVDQLDPVAGARAVDQPVGRAPRHDQRHAGPDWLVRLGLADLKRDPRVAVGEWAWDEDGDGVNEVHCNTLEGIRTGLRDDLRKFRGVNKTYLAQDVAVFLWAYNIKAITDDFLRALLGVEVPTDGRT